MKRFILLAVFAMAFTLVRAQINSSLTVMTDDGQRFYLFLGGKLINSSPENNMKVQQLRERYYSCKIIFEDKALRDIRLKYLPLADANNLNTSVEAVYRIQGNAKGKRKLIRVSAAPVPVGATSAVVAGRVVYDYGIPLPVGPPITGWQPATTTIAGDGSRSSSSATYATVRPDTSMIQGVSLKATADSIKRLDTPCTHPMSNAAYQRAKAAMNTTTYDETKMKAAKLIATSNCLYAKQIADLCMLFDFEESKLSFARYAYVHCYDRKNYDRIVDVLRSDPNKAALRVFIMRDYPIRVNILER